jgi:ubiquinone/menaquinone biosynthesis C-methylase UbiE
MTARKANYGIDAPGVIIILAVCAGVLLPVGWFLATHTGRRNVGFWPILGNSFFSIGAICLIEVLLMFSSSLVGKFRARDRLLDNLHLRGDETVLDVGCGHGLLLIGAAKRLPRGRAVGLDLWSQKDQAANSREATLKNAEIEDVKSRVEVRDGDMREMPFANASFDAVVASLAIHNISSRDGRRKAIEEIVRVLKPGGKVALLDFQRVGQYADDLRSAGMKGVRKSWMSFWIFPPVRTVTATKPQAS